MQRNANAQIRVISTKKLNDKKGYFDFRLFFSSFFGGLFCWLVSLDGGKELGFLGYFFALIDF